MTYGILFVYKMWRLSIQPFSAVSLNTTNHRKSAEVTLNDAASDRKSVWTPHAV